MSRETHRSPKFLPQNPKGAVLPERAQTWESGTPSLITSLLCSDFGGQNPRVPVQRTYHSSPCLSPSPCSDMSLLCSHMLTTQGLPELKLDSEARKFSCDLQTMPSRSPHPGIPAGRERSRPQLHVHQNRSKCVLRPDFVCFLLISVRFVSWGCM